MKEAFRRLAHAELDLIIDKMDEKTFGRFDQNIFDIILKGTDCDIGDVAYVDTVVASEVVSVEGG